jgi:hypothetical protein
MGRARRLSSRRTKWKPRRRRWRSKWRREGTIIFIITIVVIIRKTLKPIPFSISSSSP